MDLQEPALFESDETVAANAMHWNDRALEGVNWQTLKQAGWARLNLPDAPFADGGFRTPSGKCEFFSERLAQQGLDPLPDYLPPHESADGAPELAARYPLAMISPPARNFLNSTFVNVESLRSTEGEPHLDIHPADAHKRKVADGDLVRIFNDRGSMQARARVTDRAREGLVVGLSIWWKKLAPDGRNANQVTSQALTDLGGSATFYDCLVEVERV
jgi:anaerobic selenocysteine-containing dehydrogenase